MPIFPVENTFIKQGKRGFFVAIRTTVYLRISIKEEENGCIFLL